MSRLLDLGEVIELHCDQVSRYGGTSGIRHTGALRAAVGQRAHGEDVFALAAGYCLDFVAMRPFPDGNARVGMVAALVCLELNGVALTVADDALVATVEALRTRTMGAAALADFLRVHAGRPATGQTRVLAAPAPPPPGHPAASSVAVAETAGAAAAEIAAAGAASPAPKPDRLAAPAGPAASPRRDRPTSVRDLADAFRDDADEPAPG